MTDVTATNFTTFEESTADDWAIIMQHIQVTQSDGDARREGRRDDEYVLCALLHDIGDNLAPYNHPSIAAGILKAFVSEANHWMVEHHGIFQGYYFWHHIGLDRRHFESAPGGGSGASDFFVSSLTDCRCVR